MASSYIRWRSSLRWFRWVLSLLLGRLAPGQKARGSTVVKTSFVGYLRGAGITRVAGVKLAWWLSKQAQTLILPDG